LSDKELSSESRAFTVKLTVNRAGSPETTSTIYRHLSRTIGAWEQATFRDVSTSIGRSAVCERRHRALLRVETASKKKASSKCNNSLSYRDYSSTFLPSRRRFEGFCFPKNSENGRHQMH
jgi:hypothetical protein